MATRVSLQEFDAANDTITRYLQRVTLYFTANEIKAELQVPTLLSSIGASTFDRLCDLLAPTAPETKTLAELTTLLQKHFEPPRVVIAERFNFQKREQAAGETIAKYDAALRKLATHCGFGDDLENRLRDQIVCGIRKESDQTRLLTEADLTYKRTIEVIRSFEAADKTAKSLRRVGEVFQVPRKPVLVPADSPRIRTPPQEQPRGCGGKHKPSDCRFKEATCHYCKKPGHIAKVCRARAR